MTAGYQPIEIHHELSGDAVHLIRDQLDMQLADVHAMMRLPIETDPGLGAGCNLASAQILLSVVSGVSTTLFKRDVLSNRRGRRKLFVDAVKAHYPWDQEFEASGRRSGADAAQDLYALFRNPLAHTLGVADRAEDEEARQFYIAKAPMAERDLVELETTGPSQDRWLAPTLVLNGQRLTLCVRSFYWGVRQMIERVARTPDACAFSFPSPLES